MKTSIYPIIVWFLSFSVHAQELTVIHNKQIYKEVSGMKLSVDIFSPGKPENLNDYPAIALFHGGGWAFGSPEEFYGACERFAKEGLVAFSFQYRLSIREDGTYPHPDISPIESVKDARSAVRWLRENAGDLGIDPDRIIVGGQSAGGQLALSTALLDQFNEETDNMEIDPTPNALVLYSSCVNTMEAWIDNLLGDRRDQIWSISPYHNLKPGMPPVLAFHGESDCQVLFYTILFFSDRMKSLGNHYELIRYEGRGHYLGEGGEERYSGYFDEEILERTDDFLREHGYMD